MENKKRTLKEKIYFGLVGAGLVAVTALGIAERVRDYKANRAFEWKLLGTTPIVVKSEKREIEVYKNGFGHYKATVDVNGTVKEAYDYDCDGNVDSTLNVDVDDYKTKNSLGSAMLNFEPWDYSGG